MYLMEKVTDKDLLSVKARHKPPLGPGFETVPEGTVCMEVWGTSFDDPGPDYCDFRLKDQDGNVLACKRVNGY
jgi:hypothetical protein